MYVVRHTVCVILLVQQPYDNFYTQLDQKLLALALATTPLPFYVG